MNRIEVIVDAIGKLNGIHDPESTAYSLRNPLLLESYAQPGKHAIDEEGRRVFDTFLQGYHAAVFDVTVKISGKSRTKLRPENELEHLLGVYKIKSVWDVDKILSFLRRALKDQDIGRHTLLSYFMETK